MSTRSKQSRIRKTVSAIALVLFTIIGIVWLKGCTITVIAPTAVEDPLDVYILDYGRHPSLVLPRSETDLVEYSYGEWQWYALNEIGFFSSLRALLVRSEGTLGRRSLYESSESLHQWWDDVLIDDIHRITVERSLAEALIEKLDQQWESARETAVYNPRNDLDHVQHPQPYTASNNSNIVLGRWLEELDCTVRGWPLLPMSWQVVTE